MSDLIADRLQADLTASMKARDQIATSTIRMLRTAIMNAEVAGTQARTLSNDEVISVLQSEAKKRSEAAQVYADAGRDESAAKEQAELSVIERYLPTKLSDDELAAIVGEEVAASGASGPQAMGQVIKAVRDRVGATADGATIAAMVKQHLVS